MNKLLVEEPVKWTVTIAGIEITSKEDWDRVVQKLADTMRENERLKAEIKRLEDAETKRCLPLLNSYKKYIKALSNKESAHDNND